MFKKKAQNNKKIDLSKEAEQIVADQQTRLPQESKQQLPQSSVPEQQQPEYISKSTKTHNIRGKAKQNIFSLEGMQKSDYTEPNKINISSNQNQQNMKEKEIQDCFNEIRQIRQKEAITIQQDLYIPLKSREQQKEKYVLRVQDRDIQSQQQALQVQIDEDGGFSPQRGMDDYEQMGRDYEDQLIRKTLTRNNYEKVVNYGGISLQKLKQDEAKDGLVQKLKKVNQGTIKKAIARDIYSKKIKLKQLQTNLAEIQSHGSNKKVEISKKQKRLNILKEQYQRVNKIIEYIYYWGDKVNNFSIEGIQKEMEERQKRKNNFEVQEEQYQ